MCWAVALVPLKSREAGVALEVHDYGKRRKVCNLKENLVQKELHNLGKRILVYGGCSKSYQIHFVSVYDSRQIR